MVGRCLRENARRSSSNTIKQEQAITSSLLSNVTFVTFETYRAETLYFKDTKTGVLCYAFAGLHWTHSGDPGLELWLDT